MGLLSDAGRPLPDFERIRTVDVGVKIEFTLRADSATYPRNCSRLQFTGGWFTRLARRSSDPTMRELVDCGMTLRVRVLEGVLLVSSAAEAH